MRIINKSKWDTRDLAKFFRECLKRVGEDIREYTIVIKNARTEGTSGWGSYTRKWMKICLPVKERIWPSDGFSKEVPLTELSGKLLERAAQVIIHESDHTRGLHHRDMVQSRSINTTWAGVFRIKLKSEKAAKSKLYIPGHR